MPALLLPPGQRRRVDRVIRQKDALVSRTVSQMDAVMRQAIDNIFTHYEKTGRYGEPTLNAMFEVSSRFYVSIIEETFAAARVEKKVIQPLVKMAKKVGKASKTLPKTIKSFGELLRNRRYWRKVNNRSEKLTKALQKQYLRKIKKQFDKIMPFLNKEEISIKEAKKVVMEAWNTSKSRVETIFRTESTNYTASAQIAFFGDDPEIIGFMFDSLRDSARTDICASRHGLIYRPNTELLRKNTPACHYNCRSHLIPLANTPYNRALLADESRDPAKKKVVPLPRGWSK